MTKAGAFLELFYLSVEDNARNARPKPDGAQVPRVKEPVSNAHLAALCFMQINQSLGRHGLELLRAGDVQ